ncbi:hypothetical protein C493_08491 [Natronolimnohabitans innermongolicus JCM 12255]|uniref:Uncharacterized protein n=1 Tax=Natronolimnohabitans innermongolicus JCM 12255 TaxID=1227499 RepID=L9X740_9EURY|nr:hypothetical protein C493_08491 [Natronolimnohabitans innermongolicus JCM 12255]
MAFLALAFLVVQYFLRRPLAGYTTDWFETGYPFTVLDQLLALVLTPVHAILDVLFHPWAPDWAFVVLTVCYFYALSLVIARVAEGARARARTRDFY